MAKVLVVDDIPDVADSFAELLTLFGHDVRIAYSAKEAMMSIQTCVPDVALLDVSMPVVDGLQLARQIRENWGTRIRLVAHTAYPRPSIAPRLVEAGFNSFISKSAQPLQLAFALHGRPGSWDLRSALGDRRHSSRVRAGSRRSADTGQRFAA
ncbi:MAG TPA: response regulator [Casimicrobiaceae bacterium]|nr:response regulator [Casimicrobiaceae bacterium]